MGVAFDSVATNVVPGDTNGFDDVFVDDLAGNLTEKVSVSGTVTHADSASSGPSVSGDGRLVAFDLFVRDRLLGRTTRVSVNSPGPGTQANGDSSAAAISADGQQVGFASDATNLILGDTNGVTDIFVHDIPTGVTERVNVGPGGVQANSQSNAPGLRGGLAFGPESSGDGR